jgi:hypothetical protein
MILLLLILFLMIMMTIIINYLYRHIGQIFSRDIIRLRTDDDNMYYTILLRKKENFELDKYELKCL